MQAWLFQGEKGGWRLSIPAQGKQSRASQGDEAGAIGEPQGSDLPLHKWRSCPFLLAPVLWKARAAAAGTASPAGRALAAPFHSPSTSVHSLKIPSRSIVVPKLPQLDTEAAIKVSMTAFVSALLVSGEHKLRLLTSFFSTQVLHLIIE